MTIHMRSRLACSLATSALSAATFAHAQPVATASSVSAPRGEARINFAVPAGPASGVLNAFASQANVRLIYPYDALNQLTSPGLRGSYTTSEALSRLIRDLPLSVVSHQGSDITLRVEAQRAESAMLDDVVVVGRAQTYSAAAATEEMIERQTAMTSVNNVVNELPGVLVTEGDYFGSSDYQTAISMRGFLTSTVAQQIGTTIDGLPNGGSNYGGGSKANRYVDVLDLRTVEVSQGTADIAARSNESLGGTLNFVTSDPLDERRLRLVYAGGDQKAHKYYGRFDTGEFLPNTRAWISASDARQYDWIDEQTETTRSHLAAKIESEVAGLDLTAYFSWNKSSETDYASVSLDYFANNPRTDYLTYEWTGIPELDQNLRDTWRGDRENTFGYVRGAGDLGPVRAVVATYAHRMTGKGNYLPPYMVDVVDDGAGLPQSEMTSTSPALGVPQLGQFYFVNPDGSAATPIAGCVPSSGLSVNGDPACYAANALAVQSFRHTHYDTKRYGLTADFDWSHDFGAVRNVLRGGFWLERVETEITRDWHRVLDSRLGTAYQSTPYWIQYQSQYETDELMYYVEDVATFGRLTARLGVKQFFVDRESMRRIGSGADLSLSSDSDPLINAGLTYALTPSIELFGGFSQNFNAISASHMDATREEVANIKPETADNIEIGVRLNHGRWQATATIYDIRFENRITMLNVGEVPGQPDYLSELNGTYANVGGMRSKGVELLGAYDFGNGFKVSGSYTYNDSAYVGSDDPNLGDALDIVEGAPAFASPKSMFVISADWRNDVWRAGVSTKYVGKRYADFAGQQAVDSFLLTNAYLGVSGENISPSLKGFDLSVVVNNLTNEVYATSIDDWGVYPAPPRTIAFAVTMDF